MPYHWDHVWDAIIRVVKQLPPHEDVRVEHFEVDGIPDDFYERPADHDGQDADYGFPLDDGAGIHVKEYDDHYRVHWDKRDPMTDPLGHLYEDSPKWLVFGGAVVVVAVGGICLWHRHSKSKKQVYG